MKTISMVAAIAALGMAGTSVLAADLPARAYTKAPVMMTAYNWTGFYLGVNAGYGVGRNRTNAVDAGPGAFSNITTYLGPAGAIGGGQVGYNWQTNMGFLGPVVLGVEADIQASGQKTSVCVHQCSAGGIFAVNLEQKMDWFGTVRGRAGLVSGPVLSYVTGGFAYGNVNTSGVVTGGVLPGVPFGFNQTRGGWTLGSGVEASLGGNWTGKIEYLYVNLGRQTQSVSTAGNAAAGVGDPLIVSSLVHDHIFRGGINYAFNGNANYTAPVANLSGLYIGGNFGSLTARNQSSSFFNPFNSTNQFSLMPDGYQGGAQIGYNWQASAWVFGVEADYQFTNAKDNKTCVLTCTLPFVTTAFEQKLPSYGTVRGRLGYVVGSTLFYATAGYAYGQTKTVETQTAGVPQTVSFKSNKGGYAVGGGIESPLTLFGLFGPAWTVKSEYLFVDLGRTTTAFTNPLAGGTDVFSTRTQEHVMRTGINYHFNAPVVAKY
jgi:outer membrane immunogenic protein